MTNKSTLFFYLTQYLPTSYESGIKMEIQRKKVQYADNEFIAT